jgi:hypothetical protein
MEPIDTGSSVEAGYFFTKNKYFPIVTYSVNYVEEEVLNKILIVLINSDNGFSSMEDAKVTAENDYQKALEDCKLIPAEKISGATIEWLAKIGYRLFKSEDEQIT